MAADHGVQAQPETRPAVSVRRCGKGERAMTSVAVKSMIVLSGLLTRHDAFDNMHGLPPLPDNSYHYVTADECNLIGSTGVMVVFAKEYNIVVADCAQARHISYRRGKGYVSDVAAELWHSQRWPAYPIPGTLYLFPPEPEPDRISGQRG